MVLMNLVRPKIETKPPRVEGGVNNNKQQQPEILHTFKSYSSLILQHYNCRECVQFIFL